MAGRYPSNSEHGATNLVAWVLRNRAKNAAQDAALLALATAVDEKLAQLKNELLGGAGEAFDTLKELQTILENGKAEVEALKELAAGHVKYDGAQSLTASQQAQARENIGAVSEAEMDAAIDAAIPLAPTARVTETATGATITITDRGVTTTAEISDGATGPYYAPYWEGDVLKFTNTGGLTNPEGKNLRGPQGEQGIQGIQGIPGIQGVPGIQGERGPRGVTFTPSISSAGVLSWHNDGGLDNPPTISVVGPVGPAGERGERGVQGERGPQGIPGEAGAVGPRGVTFTPSMSSSGVLSFTNDGGLENPSAVSLVGPKGDAGKDGEAGPYYVPYWEGDVLKFTNTGGLANPDGKNLRGPQGIQGIQGIQGVQGPAGNDGSPGKDGSPGPAGKDGVTFTPSVSSSGVLSWTNDGGLSNPTAVSILGPAGPAGQDGSPGKDGSPGATGPTGPAGKDGATAAQVIAALPTEEWTFTLIDGSTVTKKVPMI